MAAVVRMTISSASAERLRDVLRGEALDMGRARRTGEGVWTVEAYAPKTVATRLREAGLGVEVDDEFEARSVARRAEVGRGDRFEGGRVPPRGLGRKE